MGKLGVYPLWIKVEDDPLEYIRRAKTIMDRKKISLEAFILYGIIKFTSTLFGKKVEYAYNVNYLINTFCFVANFPLKGK